MPSEHHLKSPMLNNKGLNLQAVFNINELPDNVIRQLEAECLTLKEYQQLILIGHGGTTLWQSIQSSIQQSTDPIDEYSVKTVNEWFTNNYPEHNATLIYPGEHLIGLQTLGTLAGWHHTSPFMVGINAEWGSWYAYRAVLLTDTQFEPTQVINTSSPCNTCESKVCIKQCPANACSIDSFNMDACIHYRKSEDSKCKETCLARISCPVASKHRYSEPQLSYHYSASLKTIESLDFSHKSTPE